MTEMEKFSMYHQNPDVIGFLFRLNPFPYHYWGWGVSPGLEGLGNSQRDINVKPLRRVIGMQESRTTGTTG